MSAKTRKVFVLTSTAFWSAMEKEKVQETRHTVYEGHPRRFGCRRPENECVIAWSDRDIAYMQALLHKTVLTILGKVRSNEEKMRPTCNATRTISHSVELGNPPNRRTEHAYWTYSQ